MSINLKAGRRPPANYKYIHTPDLPHGEFPSPTTQSYGIYYGSQSVVHICFYEAAANVKKQS